jgi:nitroreductase
MDRPITEIVRRRFSCRAYLPKPVSGEARSRLRECLARMSAGPFGSPVRVTLVAASEDDATALKGLGTYGTIRSPQGFLVGVMGSGERNLEDFGCVMEEAVLRATDLGLGTCWLGGFFQRSRFAGRAGVAAGESVPAVVSIGYCADEAGTGGLFGRVSRRSTRLPPERLFFAGGFDRALAPDEAVAFAPALDAVRLAPSASNKQPWRLVRQDGRWHFFLRRTPGYRNGIVGRLAGRADLQRIDLGIAMCHFDLAAREAGMSGVWDLTDPGLPLPDGLMSYAATWRPPALASGERV